MFLIFFLLNLRNIFKLLNLKLQNLRNIFKLPNLKLLNLVKIFKMLFGENFFLTFKII